MDVQGGNALRQVGASWGKDNWLSEGWPSVTAVSFQAKIAALPPIEKVHLLQSQPRLLQPQGGHVL